MSQILIAVNYHYIRDSFKAPGIFGVTPREFERQLEMLGCAGTFVSAGQIRDAVQGRGQLPENSIAVTFDDGLREQYEMAWPILRRIGAPAIFFINSVAVADQRVLGVHKIHLVLAKVLPRDLWETLRRHASDCDLNLDARISRLNGAEAALAHYNYDAPETARLKYLLNFVLSPGERDCLIESCFAEIFPNDEAAISRRLYLDVGQIEALGAHQCVGTHSHDHLPLGLLPHDEVKTQIESSLVHLEKWAGYRPYAMSYPYGSRQAVNGQVASIAAEAGIEFAFTTERAGNRDLTRPLRLARFDCNDLPGGKAAVWTVENLFDCVPSSIPPNHPHD
jgi:peptidoglycan/xylan/chitin deacetylase (PgdA/CDA1 family)